MPRTMQTVCLVLGIVALLHSPSAKAQAPKSRVYGRPTISPYLNLLRDDFSGLSNYHTLVRPEFEQRTINQRQGGAIRRLEGEVQSAYRASRDGELQTGHRTYFMNYSHFYPSLSNRRR